MVEAEVQPNLSEPFYTTTVCVKMVIPAFQYEWSRRRLSLIKMINGVEEVLIVLFTAFGYEYLF
jgi:hypothetical protein